VPVPTKGGGVLRVTTLSIVIPAYNEVGRIRETIADVCRYMATQAFDYEVIVAVDGNDGTADVVRALAAENPRIRLIEERSRRGKGYAIRRGVSAARGDVIGFIDADNKTPIDDFDKVEPLLQQGYHVVIGSRAMTGSRIERRQPWYRRVGSRGFSVFMHAAVGLRDIGDTQCGFKFFTRSAALDLFSRQRVDGYMFDVEILSLAERTGLRIAQVPVRWRDDGDSRLELFRGNARNLIDVLSIGFSRSISAPDETFGRAGTGTTHGEGDTAPVGAAHVNGAPERPKPDSTGTAR
jgi:dolichyl-phosphate beta-glucosyltransferase